MKFSPLSLKTLLLVLAASMAAFVVVTTATYFVQRSRLLDQAHEAAATSVAQNKRAISQSLWDYDQPVLQAILAGMVQSGSVVGAEIIERGKPVLSAQRGDDTATIDRVWQLDLRSPDGATPIGVLQISECYAEIRQRMITDALLLGIGELFQIAGLSVILLLIVYRLITRHLRTLADGVRQLDVGGGAGLLALQRHSQSRDELDELVDALNRFRHGQAEEQRRRLHAETVLRERIAEIETTLGALTAGVMTLDREGRVMYANLAARSLLGKDSDDIIREHFASLLTLHDETGQTDMTGMVSQALADEQSVFSRGALYLRPRGLTSFDIEIALVPVRDAGDAALILVFRDISSEIARERQIEYQAFHDPLTGLGNRSLLMQKLPAEIESARASGERVAVLYVDLDNFKDVNDNLGHSVGDRLLRQLGERLRGFLTPRSWATRQGGDEFIVVVPEPGTKSALAATVEQLMALIREPYKVDGVELRVSSSVGISFFPDHGDVPGELISRADMGMFVAKKLGRNTFSIFDEKLQLETRKHLAIANALKSALRTDEFTLFYQPLIDLSNSRIVAAEVLLRWNSAELGNVSPAVFIPIAEETGLIVDIGDWVLRQAAATVMRWHRVLGHEVVLAVNISALQFQSPRLLATLRRLSDESIDYTRLLTLEITETALVGDVQDLSEKLTVIRQMGYRIAIDDFGTGYSSLSYLRKLPVDTLKIDREFIRELHESEKAVAIVSAIIQLAKSLDFEIVAEGVEHAEGIKILGDLKCDVAQGFYYSRPVPEDQFLTTLQAWAFGSGRIGGSRLSVVDRSSA